MGHDMNRAIGNQVLLTSDDVMRWQMELQEAEAAKATAEDIIADRRKKLDAATLLSGVVFATMTLEYAEPESMRAAVERILGQYARPVQHHELQAELRKIPRFKEMLDKHKGAYYYTLIKRLADDEPPKIKKVGKKIRLIHKEETPTEIIPEGVS